MHDKAKAAMAKKRDDDRLAREMVVDPTMDPSADSVVVVRWIVGKVDALALAMERKWGRGVLPGIAGGLLAAKFESQAAKFDAAVASGISGDAVRHGEAMVRAWNAVEQAALNIGKRPRPVAAFSADLPCGGTLHIVEAQEDVARITDRGAVVMSVAEVASLLSRDELGRLVVGVKKVFDAEVKKPPADFTVGDDLPF
jgi:hypothetical protein